MAKTYMTSNKNNKMKDTAFMAFTMPFTMVNNSGKKRIILAMRVSRSNRSNLRELTFPRNPPLSE